MVRKQRKALRKLTSIGKVVRLTRRESYMKAKKRLGFKRNDVNNWPGYCKITTTIARIISKHITSQSEGVFLKDVGYFGAILRNTTSKNPFFYFNDEVYLNASTNGAIFGLSFTPIPRKGKFNSFTTFIMDSCFAQSTKKNFSNELISGRKYRNNVAMFFNR